MSLFLLFLFIISLSNAQQIPQSRQVFRQQFKTNRDFMFDLQRLSPAGSHAGGEIRRAVIDNFPALSGEGLSYNLLEMEPCAVNLPHVHPRASELVFVISGKFLRIGFVEENGGRTIVNDLEEGQVGFWTYFMDIIGKVKFWEHSKVHESKNQNIKIERFIS